MKNLILVPSCLLNPQAGICKLDSGTPELQFLQCWYVIQPELAKAYLFTRFRIRLNDGFVIPKKDEI